MFKMQCLLALVALFVNVAHSWDFAVTIGDQIYFYSNGTKTSAAPPSVEYRFRELSALAYDAVHNMLLFVDKENDNASIFSYHLETKQYQPLVRKKVKENIQGLAFEPVQKMLFWVDGYDKSIKWISLKPESNNNSSYGNVLMKLDNELPQGITVDSCRGFIYWTNTNVSKPSIERARFDGTDRRTVVDSDIYKPVSISIDQRTKRLFWMDKKEGIHYSLESSNLEGKDRRTILTGTHHMPTSMAVGKDALYWVDWGYKSVFQFDKQKNSEAEPIEIINYNQDYYLPFGVVANYKIEDQIKGVEECKEVSDLSKNETAISNIISIPNNVGIFCLHGVMTENSVCQCKEGYTGHQCDVEICHNFCLNGNCTVGKDKNPHCSCNNGYSGKRCEINICNGFCLNDGACTMDQNNKPLCLCSGNYVGDRCQNVKTAKTEPEVVYVKEPCNCSNSNEKPTPVAAKVDKSSSESESSQQKASSDVITCDDGWDSVRDPILMVLGIICGLLCIVCALLVTKVMQLKKRPRIKKRIIVNKNVTPLTARPDSCEITIENCCNMNICETPCFEPRSTIRPNLLEGKPGKEEKKNLIANMEYPEDY